MLSILHLNPAITPADAIFAPCALARPARLAGSRSENEAPVDFLYRTGIHRVELCEAGNIGDLDVASEHDPPERMAS